MSWVKQEVIIGRQVTIAILMNGGSDPQYDHEVAVARIGANHSPTDPTYHPDDVVYFDDHGNYHSFGQQIHLQSGYSAGCGFRFDRLHAVLVRLYFCLIGQRARWSQPQGCASLFHHSVTEGFLNPHDPVAGHNYENAIIGTSLWGWSCTNEPLDDKLCPAGHREQPYTRHFMQLVRVRVFSSRRRGHGGRTGGSGERFQR